MAAHGREFVSHTDGAGQDPARPHSPAHFATTRWTIVLAATHPSAGDSARQAMEELIKAYWMPLYVFVRRHCSNPHQAEDLTQGFFAHLLEHTGLASADRAKGRFRSFLLASIRNYMADQHDKSSALKRGGGRKIVSLDAMQAESHYHQMPVDTLSPDRLFERSWAISLLNHVLLRLEQEYAGRGKAQMFTAMRHTLDGQAPEQSYTQLADQLGTSEGSVRVMAHRLRQRYRQLLRDEIMQTVADDQQVDDEIRYLLKCL